MARAFAILAPRNTILAHTTWATTDAAATDDPGSESGIFNHWISQPPHHHTPLAGSCTLH